MENISKIKFMNYIRNITKAAELKERISTCEENAELADTYCGRNDVLGEIFAPVADRYHKRALELKIQLYTLEIEIAQFELEAYNNDY